MEVEVFGTYGTYEDGETVRIVDSGQNYSTNIPWLEKYVNDEKLRYRYDYGFGHRPQNGNQAVIICHGEQDGKMLYYIKELNEEERYYIIGERGIRK